MATQRKSLPRINKDQNTDTTVNEVNNIADLKESLDVVRKSITTMSSRLSNNIISLKDVMNDFVNSQKNSEDTFGNSFGKLYSIDVKLGSIAMMISEFFDFQKMLYERGKLLDNNPDQVRPPKEPKPEQDEDKSKGMFDKLKDIDTSGFVQNLLTGIGLAFLASKMNISKEIEQSGIVVYVAKAFSRSFMALSGITKLSESLTSLPAVKNTISLIGKAISIVSKFAELFVPFYGLALRLGGFAVKFVPMIAMITSVVDFMRGWERGVDTWDGVKEGLAEVAAGWIGWPLEILKDIIAWVSQKFGFDNIKEWLDGVDLVEVTRDGVRSIMNTFKSIFYFDPSQFNAKDWTLKIIDIVWSPVNAGINFIKDIFHIGNPETPFRVSEFIVSVINSSIELFKSIWNFDYQNLQDEFVNVTKNIFNNTMEKITGFFTEIFDKIVSLLPNTDEVINKIRSYLPDFLIGSQDGLNDISTQIALLDKKIKEQQNLIERSKAGEDVFYGPEKWGMNRATAQIEEARKIKEELLRRDKDSKATNQTNNYNIVRGGDTNNSASSVSINNGSSSIPNIRPDGFR